MELVSPAVTSIYFRDLKKIFPKFIKHSIQLQTWKREKSFSQWHSSVSPILQHSTQRNLVSQQNTKLFGYLTCLNRKLIIGICALFVIGSNNRLPYLIQRCWRIIHCTHSTFTTSTNGFFFWNPNPMLTVSMFLDPNFSDSIQFK